MRKLLQKIFYNKNISYGITVNNEVDEITRLLDTLLPLIDKNDEVIVLQDITNKSQKVADVLDQYGDKIVRLEARLDGDFATFKNNLIKAASKDYLFQIDADEIPEKSLIRNLKPFLFENKKADCFLIPRINIVNNISDNDIKSWNWTMNAKGFINFPDYQTRLFKLNGGICWQNKIHEVLVNYKRLKEFPIANEDFCLIHRKEIEKQKSQNAFYENL